MSAHITLAQSLCYPDQFNAYRDHDLIATIAIAEAARLLGDAA